jgi:hypothetical protein
VAETDGRAEGQKGTGVTKFQYLALGMMAWLLSDVMNLSLALARHMSPDDPITWVRHAIGIPLGITLGIWGFYMFWKGIFA